VSFILDALRKSEHERQRQTGPALVESAVAPPRPRSNVWPTVAIVLLLVNIVAIGVVLLMKSGDAPEAATPAATVTSATPPVATSGPVPAAPAAATAAQASVTRTLPEPQLAAPPPRAAPNAPLRSARNPLEDEVASSASAPAAEASMAATQPPPGPAAVRATRPGKVIYQTLPEADVATNYAPAPAAAATANLPTADEITARGALPELRLELHVYSNRPQDRFVFLNGSRYREGDTTAEGAAIQEITPDGVVMSAGGNRFLLPRD
jgi:general secretion pathway protein B